MPQKTNWRDGGGNASNTSDLPDPADPDTDKCPVPKEPKKKKNANLNSSCDAMNQTPFPR